MAREWRSLELTLISAEGLKNANLLPRSKMEVYALVWLSADRKGTCQRVPADRAGGCNPTWNATLTIGNVLPAGTLHVLLRAQRALGDRDVGKVEIHIADLLSAGNRQDSCYVRHVTRTDTWEPQGFLACSYKLGEAVHGGRVPSALARQQELEYFTNRTQQWYKAAV